MVGFSHSEYISARPIRPIRIQPRETTISFLKPSKRHRLVKRSPCLVSAVHLEEMHPTSKSIRPLSSNSPNCPPKNPKCISPVTLQVLAKIFKTAPSPHIVTYTIFIKFLGNLGYAVEAFELFAFMKENHKPDTISFTVIIRVLCDYQMFDHALELFHEMLNYDCRPDIICYNTLIDKFGEAGDEKQVQKLVSKMEADGIHADVVTYSSVLKSHCVTGKIDKALSVLRFMEMSKTVQPNTYTYNTLIKVYLDHKFMREALGILGRMETRGCKPDLCSYNLFINYYSNLGKGVEARIFLKKMVIRDIEPSESSYTMCLYGLMKQCKVDLVLEVIEDVKRSRVALSVCSWNNVIFWLGKMRRVDEAYSLFLEMQNPDEITMNIVIQLLYRYARGEEAWGVFSSMKEKKIKASILTYNILIHGLCMEGNISKAFELVNQMEGEKCIPPDVVTYNCLLKSLCNRQEVEDACRLILKMLKTGCKPDLISINTLIYGLTNAGRTEDAARLFEHLREDIAAHSVPLGTLLEEMLTS